HESNLLLQLLLLLDFDAEPVEFHLMTQSMSWEDARSFCRLKHSDLATVQNRKDQGLVLDLLHHAGPQRSWVGLRRTSTAHWRWSDGRGTLQSADTPPHDEEATQRCVKLTPDGAWKDSDCAALNTFVCYELNGENMVRFAHYSAMATWRTAQDTCRNNHMDLVTVTSTEINSAVQGLVTAGHEAWIGLFRDAWEWSDGSDTSYRSWVDGGDGDGDCAAASVEHEGFWSVTQCTEKLPFVCEGG
ncbi:hypothetical protein NQD34_013927, partial [Periophthalmus magnuspinnatus]